MIRQATAHGLSATRPDDGGSWEKFESLTLDSYPRLQRLRSELLAAQTAIGIERASLLTGFFRQEGFDESRPVIRQARALSFVLNRLPTVVFDDELIVGSTTRHRLGTLLFPEFMALAIWPELPTIGSRAHDPVAINDAEVDHLANDIFPFWRDKTVHEHVRRMGDNPRSLRLADHMLFYMLGKYNGITHIIPDYAAVVSRGLSNLVEESAARERDATDEETAQFHGAVQIALSPDIS